MIKIQRGPCPNQLDTTIRHLVKADYRNPEVVTALLTMQNFKCCFCEKNLPSLGNSARWVEHFVAKTEAAFKKADGSINWDLANAWSNLLYSCSTCNNSKGDYKAFSASGRRQLIDPSDPSIDPENHIEFFIDDVVIYYKECPGSALGRNTIKNLKVKDRRDLYSFLIKRKLIIDGIFFELLEALIDGNHVLATSKLNVLTRATSASEPHSSFSRKYISQLVNKFNQVGLTKINSTYKTNIQPLTVNIATGATIIN